MFVEKKSPSYLLTSFIIFSCFLFEITLACTPSYNNNKLTVAYPCTAGYYLLKSNDVVDSSGVGDCTSSSKCTLYKCSTVDGETACTASTITGYAIFALDNTKGLSCTNGSCISFSIDSGTSCSDTLVGGLINSAVPALCEASSGSGVALSSATAVYHYLEIPSSPAASVPFTANSKILVKVESNSVSIVDNGTYYIKTSDNSLSTETEFENDVGGAIKKYVVASNVVSGTVETSCKVTDTSGTVTLSADCKGGYYLIENNAAVTTSALASCSACKLYSCPAVGEGETSSNCSEESTFTGYAIFALNDSGLSCSSGTCVSYSITGSCNSVGVLFDTTSPKLCNVSGGSGIALSGDTATYHYLEIPSSIGTGVPFTASQNILVVVENNSVSVVADGDTYVNNSDNTAVADNTKYDGDTTGAITKYTISSGAATPAISCKVTVASESVTISAPCAEGNYLINDGTPVTSETLAACTGTACKLYSCPAIAAGSTSATCSASPITGYAIFAPTSSGLACTSGSCISRDITAGTSCSKAGDLYNPSAPTLCEANSGGTGIVLSTTTEKYYLLAIASGETTPFTGSSATTAETKVLVKVDKNIVSLVTETTYITNSDNTEAESTDYESDITGAITKYTITDGVATAETSCVVTYTSGTESLTITSTCNVGYYLISSSSTVIDKAAVASASGCTPWKCPAVADNAQTANCEKVDTIMGYIPFALDGTLLTCTSGTCSKATVGTGSCGAGSLGALVDTATPKFCTGTTEDSAVAIASEGLTYHYLEIPSGTTGLPFTAEKNYLIEVGGGAAIVVNDSEKYVIKESKGATDSDTFMACATHNSITRYTITTTTGEVTATKDCVQVCTLLETSATGCVAEGYYIADAQKVYTEADNKEGTLYYCSSATSCKAVATSDLPIGYLLNAGNRGYTTATDVPYIMCKLDQGSVKCKAMAVSGTACTASTVGVINDSGVYKLCLGTATITDNVELSTTATTTEKYFVSMAGANVFGALKASHFVIVNLSKGNALLNNDNLDRYQITLTSTVYKIQEKTVENCSSVLCPSNTLVSTLKEYSLNKEEGETLNYYKQV